MHVEPTDASGRTIPVTILAGFLGAGKTTLLKRLLENRDGLKVGVVVNDVAAVNVDANFISSQLAGADGVEVSQLQNGCVCCSLSDDLFASISALMARSEGGGFDHLLLELSGVSEPSAVKQNWEVARQVRHPAALRCEIDRVVTVVDASCFAEDWNEGRSASSRNTVGAGDDDNHLNRPVVELLAEQVETADVILLNKADLVSQEHLRSVEALLVGVNSSAEVLCGEYGGVDLAALLPQPRRALAPTVAPAVAPAATGGTGHGGGHGGGHSNDGDHGGGDGHGHGHDHDHDDDHGHGHQDGHGHDNGHGHGHGHGHIHGSGHGGTSPSELYGIHSFIYRARRPFHSGRFHAFVDGLSERRATVSARALQQQPGAALKGLLRAKGTCWLSSEPLYEHAWSFAGLSWTMAKGNPWWAACSEQHIFLRAAYPGMQAVYDRMRAEAWDEDGGWGDRRQELVFIGGAGLDEAEVSGELNRCLLTDQEFTTFVADFRDAKAPFELNFCGVSMNMT